MTRESFARGINLLCEAFRHDATDAFLEAYWIGLSEIEDDAFGRAVHFVIRNSRFMPSVAEILDASGQGDMRASLRAAEAWTKIRPLISEDGGDLDDPLAQRVIAALGGWRVLGDRSVEENSTWTRKQFIDLYIEYARTVSKRVDVAIDHDASKAEISTERVTAEKTEL